MSTKEETDRTNRIKALSVLKWCTGTRLGGRYDRYSTDSPWLVLVCTKNKYANVCHAHSRMYPQAEVVKGSEKWKTAEAAYFEQASLYLWRSFEMSQVLVLMCKWGVFTVPLLKRLRYYLL